MRLQKLRLHCCSQQRRMILPTLAHRLPAPIQQLLPSHKQLYLSPQFPPFPWLWVPREAYGYPGKAMDSGRLSASASLSALQPAEQWFLGHIIRTGVEVHISKTSWVLLTLFPKPFPRGPSSLPTQQCQPQVKDSSSSLPQFSLSPGSLSKQPQHSLWSPWHKKSLKVESSK